MLKPKGYALIIDPEAPVWERDTASCCHCNAIIFVKPGTASTVYMLETPDGRWVEEPGASCYRCMKPVCLKCYDIGECTPFERWLETLEGRKRPTGRIII